jgi:putative transcriptional regulator
MLQPGQYIFASPLLHGDYFEGARIYLVKHDPVESIGFIINRPSGRHLNELQEFNYVAAVPLWEGGPVGQDHLYLVHQRPDLINGGTRVDAGWYWGGSMDELVQAISAQIIEETQFKLFLGYCGWDAGELDQEYKEGCWLQQE